MPSPRPERSVEALVDDLRRLGVAAGDLLWVHASLRAVGPVAGGAAGVLEALDAAVGPSGTLFMTIGARDDWGWVNDRPESERAALLADAEPFDVRLTPADPDVGVLAEVFRTRLGTLVNDNPEGRMGACGRLARRLIDEAPWDHYYGPGSPVERFVHERGRVLRLGADPDTTTVIHYAEYLAPVPNKRTAHRRRRVLGPHGPQIRVVHSLDDCAGIVDRPGEEDYFVTILRAYLATGRAAVGRVGGAASELIDAADLVEFAVAWMAENLRPR